MDAKVLVASPTFSGMKYCHNDFFSGIKNLSYPDYEIMIVDNSIKNEYFKELKKIGGITLIKDEHESSTRSILRLISSRNKILEYAKENNYNYVLMLDSDVIPPKDIIQRLLAHDKEIVSGLYYNFFNIGRKIKYNPVCWLFLSEKEFEELRKKCKLPESVKTRFDLRRHLTDSEAKSNKLYEVAVPGAGCMLISRKVFSKVRYGKLDSDISKSRVDDDIYFISKAREEGFKVYCDTSLKCDHLIKGKYEKVGNKIVHMGFRDLSN